MVEFDQDGGDEVGRFVGILDGNEFLAFSSPGGAAITRSGDTFKAFRGGDGHQLWSRTIPLGEMRGYRVYDDVTVAQSRTRLVAFALSTGAERWARLGSNQIVDHQRTGYVLVRRGADMSVVDALTGNELGQRVIEEPPGVSAKHVLTKDVVYVAEGTSMAGYELPMLQQLWTTTLPGDAEPDDVQAVDRGVIVQVDRALHFLS